MTRLKTLILSLFAAVAAASAVAPAALAQGTVIVAIDDARILRDSKAGKDIQNKLKNIETQIRGELDPTAKSLESEGKNLETEGKGLQPKLQGKTQQQLAADTVLMGQVTALDKKLKDYAKKLNDFNTKRATVNQEYAMTEQKALIDFNKALEPAVMEVIKEKNAQLVVSRGAVVFAADSIDVTSLVIQKLDQKTPSVAVTRQRAPAKAATPAKTK